MLFGDRSIFAIEVFVETAVPPASVLTGRIVVWWTGRALGDLAESHCLLYPAYAGFVEVFRHNNTAWCRFLLNWGESFDTAPRLELIQRDGHLIGLRDDEGHVFADVTTEQLMIPIGGFISWYEATAALCY